MVSFGCSKSSISITDYKITVGSFPKTYDLSRELPPVRDQGSVPKCVSVSLTDMINFKLRYLGRKIAKDDYFFNNRGNKSIQGMIPKEALISASKSTPDITYKVKSFTAIDSIDKVKYAIVAFGPVMSCLMAKSTSEDFWNGSSDLGGHAVLFTGYDTEGFILRNSWGYSYGTNGYTKFPYSEFSKIFELWSIIN